MNRFGWLLGSVVILLIIAALIIPTPRHVLAQVGPQSTVLLYNTGDPCANPNVVKSFKAVAISTATTTELVAAAASKVVYVCALTATVAGTTPTLLFQTGTKVSTACDTGPTSQSGTYAPTSGAFVKIDANGGTILTGGVSGELCLVSGGTGPSIQGSLAYVQQ